MIRPIAAIALFCGLPLSAQESDPEKNPSVTASIIPVGANSDAYWEGDGPGMRAIALDPDAAPPSTLSFKTKKGLLTIPTTLNRPSPAMPVIGGRLRVFANSEVGENEEPPLFADFPISAASGHFDIFVSRSPARKTWEQPESLVLPSDTTAYPMGSFRLVNLCNQGVKARIGQEIVNVPAGKAKIFAPSASTRGKLVAVQAAHADKGEVKIFLRSGIRVDSDQRANLVFYPGRDSKNPCKATWYHQSSPSLMTASKDKAKTP